MGVLNIPIHEFKARLSRYLAAARAGRTIEITSHRKVVARVTGVPPAAGVGIARLIASGVAAWGGGKPAGAEVRLAEGGRSLADLVREDRG
jgi:prevent-host-death family protein